METVQRQQRKPHELFLYVLFILVPIPLLFALNQAILRRNLDGLHWLLIQLVALAATPNLVALSHQPPSISTVPTVPVITPPPPPPTTDKGAHECDELVRSFLAYADSTEQWESIYTSSDPIPIQVFHRVGTLFCFKMVATLTTPAAVAFDLLSDILKRPTWDSITDSTRILRRVDPQTRIQYMRTKPVWPTSARDIVMISHMRRLSDGRLLNVTKSVNGETNGQGEVNGVVRMEAGVAGQVVSTLFNQDTCRIVQIVDGDPKGWIPKSVVSMVATKETPKSLVKLNKILTPMTKYYESKALAGVAASEETVQAVEERAPSIVPVPTKAAPTMVNTLQFRIKRLETQVTQLLGLNKLQPNQQQVVHWRKRDWVFGLGRLLGGMGITAVWAAAITFALRRYQR